MAKFIVIDGLDGCGKATQVKCVTDYLHKNGYKVRTISFPAYESNSSALLKMYLNGEFGQDASKINPYISSSFYAVDRFAQFYLEYFKYFEEDDNTIILSDRYISANIIHQTSKLSNIKDKHDFIKWTYDYECKLCGLPMEDITILMTIPPEISQSLLSNRYKGDDTKKDIHESNLEYLKTCYDQLKDTVNYINKAHIANWEWLDCSTEDNKSIQPIEDITTMLIDIIEKQVM